jgi:hypothetical protein
MMMPTKGLKLGDPVLCCFFSVNLNPSLFLCVFRLNRAVRAIFAVANIAGCHALAALPDFNRTSRSACDFSNDAEAPQPDTANR